MYLPNLLIAPANEGTPMRTSSKSLGYKDLMIQPDEDDLNSQKGTFKEVVYCCRKFENFACCLDIPKPS